MVPPLAEFVLRSSRNVRLRSYAALSSPSLRPLVRRPPGADHRGMIEVDHVTKRYGDKLAVDDLTFTVRPGIVTGFLGPNGAGKSTTMRVILGLDAPTAGTARIDGAAYRDLTAP